MMPTIGLTGGIGTGKSTVADMLARRGAALVDADLLAREVVEPGGPAYEPLVERFGKDVLLADGTLDRAALARIVFSDPDALAALNAITHPAIGVRMAEEVGAVRREDTVPLCVVVIPLLRQEHVDDLRLDAVVVVDCPPDVAVQRLIGRGMDEADARARIAAQVSREERLAQADYVIDNAGGAGTLEEKVDAAWAWAVALGSRP